jgi:multiple sugar transport system ATP-binding protein
MNFLTVKVSEEGGAIMISEGNFKVKVDPRHVEYLKKYVGKEVYFGIRPEDLDYQEKAASENNMPTKVTVVEPLGADIHLWLTVGNQSLVARTGPQFTFKVGDVANFVPSMDKARYFDRETELAILTELATADAK